MYFTFVWKDGGGILTLGKPKRNSYEEREIRRVLPNGASKLKRSLNKGIAKRLEERHLSRTTLSLRGHNRIQLSRS